MRNQINQDVECTLFRTAFDTLSYTPATLGNYFADVVNGKYKQPVENVRALVASGRQEEANACKKNLPLLVAGGRMEGGRKREHLVGYSRCVTGDLDHVPGSPAELLCRAKALAYVKAGHISPSGTGLKLFVLVDSDMEHHEQAFAVVSRLLEADLPGVKVDPSGKDPNRGCFVSYDPTAFYKEVAEVVNIPVAPDQTDVFSPSEPRSLSNYIDKFEMNNPFTDGYRHSYVVRLASALNSAGFSQAEVTAECLYRYTAPGFGEKEILTTVGDIYRRYRTAHGSKNWCPPAAAATAGSLKSIKSITGTSENADLSDGSPLGPDIDDEDAGLPHFEKALLAALPTVLADALKGAVDDTEFDVLLLSSLTVLSTALPGVRGMNADDICYPPFYTLVIGPSGSGKGCISRAHKLVVPWQRAVYDNSFRKVAEYKKEKEAYELDKMKQRQGKSKPAPGTPLEEPQPVIQQQLHISGYTSTARMNEQLEANDPYASLLFENELESINNTLAQDFGGYGSVLNEAFHHEIVANSSKHNGSSFILHPKLGVLASGTPGMLLQLIPSTEKGLYSRFLIYRITGMSSYHPLTSSDDKLENAFYFDELGTRVLKIAQFLEKSSTFISFTDRQRKKLDRYFEREYYNVRVFGNEDIASVVLRHRMIIFRICMVLTALRKGEAELDVPKMKVGDDDFEMAFHIGTCCLRHSQLVSTTMKHSNSELHFKMPTAQLDLFAAMPDKFSTAEILEESVVRGISRASVFRMLKNAKNHKLLISYASGYYQKTDLGKSIAISDMG
ncbi:DUF3987 domain-containing protein [Parabacteroides gordonii]|uniref:BT4734-like N-terminal domain-containing protein n=1 Tax=Parabacteroides gordonii MS-1 = DSM 23371 TaxID=1203610 RepID=A0A0F5JC08_9BACT|nr:DUF3987 domain-containing protein [Parabacteroides gordonii]KKB55258.1 hypothetical protein HMPREF1536_02721 [Parabacteroides gordonii MS-1 = DSM 23371]MCA5581945.1 DUF3987 domain-containing protein [Parabacteroides gordonii]